MSDPPRGPATLAPLTAAGRGVGLLLWPLALLAAGAVHLWLLLHWWLATPAIYDAGIVVHGGQRVAEGQVPYRDFFTFFGPLTFWITGGVFRLFGASAATLLGLVIAVGALHGLAVWRLACVAGLSRLAALGPWLVAVGVLYPLWPVPSHHWYATLLLDGMLLLLAAPRGWPVGTRRALAAGVLAGGAALCFQAVGTAGALAALVWLAARRDGRGLLRFGLGAGLAGAAALLALIASGALGAAWEQAVLFPLHDYGGKNSVPPLLRDAVNLSATGDPYRAVGQALLAGGLGLAAPLVYAAGAWRQRGPGWSLLAGVGAATLLASAYSLTLVHFAYVAAPAVVLVTLLARDLACRLRGLALALALRQVGLVAAVALVLPVPQALVVAGGQARTLETPFGRLGLGTDADGSAAVLPGLTAMVLAASTSGEPIYVYPSLGIIYTLVGRPNATTYDYLFPGENPSHQVDDLLAQLEARRVRLVVHDTLSTAYVGERSELGALDSGRVDAYLARHYRPLGQVGQFAVLLRAD